MARPTARPKSERRRPAADRPELRELIRLFHQEGRTPRNSYAAAELLLPLSRDRDFVAGGGWKQRVADAVGVSTSTLNKCIQFHEQYGKKDLAELERMKVGWYRLTIALGVADKKRRHQLLRQAKDEGWDEHTLQRKIQQLRGTRRGGGRPPKDEKGLGLQPDLTRLIGLTRTWSQFYAAVWEKGRQGYRAELKKGLTETAGGTLGRLLEDAAEKLEAMREQCGDALVQVNALRKALRQNAAE